MKLGIVTPSHRPATLFNRLFPTLKGFAALMKENAGVEVRLLLNVQGDLTPSRAKEGWEAMCVRVPMMIKESALRAPALINQLWGDAAALWPQADVYLLLDDDHSLSSTGTPRYPISSWRRYAQCLEYLDRYRDCGVLMCEGTLGGTPAGYNIGPSPVGLIAVARGLFLRNLKRKWLSSPLFSEYEMSLPGCYGESIDAYSIMDQGFYFAKQFNNPTRILPIGKISREAPADDIHNYDLIQANGERYIRETYGDHAWTHDSKKYPKGLKVKKMKRGTNVMRFGRDAKGPPKNAICLCGHYSNDHTFTARGTGTGKCGACDCDKFQVIAPV